MDTIKIKATDDTPEVILDANTGIMEISGKSLPEDVADFYEPILNWLDTYIQNPKSETIFNFKLNYFNTASSKSLFDILLKLEKMQDKGSVVLVKRHYPIDDEDIEESGAEFSDIVNIPFEHLGYDPE